PTSCCLLTKLLGSLVLAIVESTLNFLAEEWCYTCLALPNPGRNPVRGSKRLENCVEVHLQAGQRP
ncbi:hypothetical protein ATANTOWER_020186, partial [Ataeniobius toweri]|nr:hypothetical protein [Ataeniobius toweri]